MKKLICMALTVIMLVSVTVVSGYADRGGHGGRGGHFGLGVTIGPWWPFYPAYPYPYYPYYAPPPVVTQPQPEVYVQPAPQKEETAYWYYCRNPEGYYPYVKRCPGGWMKVVPTSPPAEEEE